MTNNRIRNLFVSCILPIAWLADPVPAAAKMKVIESDVPGIAVGSEWPDDAKLPIPPGKTVRVLILPANTTRVLTGPEPDARTGRPPWGGTRSAKPKVE